ncbi:MAG: T9SS type A sorting domain-containing protein, partial [Ignavibacteria bacterium]
YITIKIHDVTGRLISELVNARQSAGLYEVEFQAGDISSGVYFYSLYADGSNVMTKKMTVAK